jgi:hypothetical protein
MSKAWLSKGISALVFAGAAYVTPAAALVCPAGEVPAGNPEQCVKRDAPKPQLDVGKYSGAQKAQAEACNRINAAHVAIIESSNEISRINVSLNDAYQRAKKADGDDKTAAEADITRWKALRKAQEDTLKQARAEENDGKKAYRKADRQLVKDGGSSLKCF